MRHYPDSSEEACLHRTIVTERGRGVGASEERSSATHGRAPTYNDP